MIPGPYSLCRMEILDPESDCVSFRTVMWGFDSREKAAEALEEGQDAADYCVVEAWLLEEIGSQ